MKNPYIVDRPLTTDDMFFGREQELTRVAGEFGAGRRVLILFGLPLIGKTSFLNQLEPLLASRHTVVRTEAPPAGTETDPLQFLLTRLAQAAEFAPPDPEALGRRNREYVADYVHALAAGLERPPLICVDALQAADLAPGRPWERDLTFLQDVLDEVGTLSLLVAARGLPGEAQSPSHEDALPHVVLAPLNEEETSTLLMAPVRGALAYDLDVIAQVYRLSGGSPFWVQLFGHVIFERRAEAGWVGKSEADDVLPLIVSHASAHIEETWHGCDGAEKVVLAAVAEMWGYHGVASARDIVSYLSRLRVRVPVADVEGALDGLEGRGVVERLGGHNFRIRQQVFGWWVKENTSTLATLKETRRYKRARLPRTSPLAGRKIDWLGMLMWGLAGALVFAIAYVWQSRQRNETWGLGGRPVAEAQAGPGRGPTPVLPAAEPGTAAGHIAFQTMGASDGPWDVHVVRADGTGRSPLVESDADDTGPVWSPDGQWVAFVSDRDDNREVYVVGADGEGLRNLTNNAAEDWTPAWSPDGQYLAFSSFRDGNWEIYLMGADGSNPVRLTENDAADYAPAWSPDGERIAFVSDRDGNLEIYSISTEGGEAWRLTDNVATDQSPAWSPDGARILWESYRDDNMEIYVAAANGSNPRNVSRDAYADDRGGSWSPWGGAIVYYSNVEGGWVLISLDLETGAKARLSSPGAVDMYPHWGP